MIAVIFLLFSFIFPVIAIGLQLIVILVIALGGILGRLLLRRPWTVRARAEDGREHRTHVRGFRASGRTRDELVTTLASGASLAA